MSHDKVTLETPQSHTTTDGGGTAAAARQPDEPLPVGHGVADTEHPLTTAEPRATLSDEPATSHTQNDGGGS